MSPNVLDIILLAVLACFIALGLSKGLTRMIFELLYLAAVFVTTVIVAPFAGRLLRDSTPLYDWLKDGMTSNMGLSLDPAVSLNQSSLGISEQTSIINSIQMPDFVKTQLIENNNSAVHESLGTNGIVEYITGFIAALLINAIAFVLLFIVLLIMFRILGKLLDIAARLPVIKTLNKTGGLIAGLVMGVLAVFITVLALSAMTTLPALADFSVQLDESLIAGMFYPDNHVLNAILNLF